MEYRVKSLSVTGLGKKIFRVGEICKDINFPEGRAKEYEAQGKLIPLDGKENTKKEDTIHHYINDNVVSDKKSISDLSKKEIVDDLLKSGVNFNPTEKKEILYNIWASL